MDYDELLSEFEKQKKIEYIKAILSGKREEEILREISGKGADWHLKLRERNEFCMLRSGYRSTFLSLQCKVSIGMIAPPLIIKQAENELKKTEKKIEEFEGKLDAIEEEIEALQAKLSKIREEKEIWQKVAENKNLNLDTLF